VWEFEEAAFEKTMQVNIKGVFLGTKYATKQMKDQDPHSNGDRGWIINLSSVYGLGGAAGTCKHRTSFIPSHRGSQYQISESQVLTTSPFQPHTKHAVMGLTKASAWDCAPFRIHVNALCPGYTQTSFIHALLTPEAQAFRADIEAKHPFRGLGTPQDIARAAVFLASEDAGWVTGIGLPIDGGYSSM
jgi:NAD(P)-dependent dehydrogenase (short-subunit alcohol dehydrogenase family)